MLFFYSSIQSRLHYIYGYYDIQFHYTRFKVVAQANPLKLFLAVYKFPVSDLSMGEH